MRSLSGAPLGALHGVPVAVKDTTPVGGRRTTLGSYTHEHWVPERDAYVVTALRRAGAVIVAQTTAPEFAHSLITDSPLWGATRNPWDLTRTTGGSSGGSGAAVASGCVPLAEGTDMGGSVRIPASWCGVVGLKPGIGRIPMDCCRACSTTSATTDRSPGASTTPGCSSLPRRVRTRPTSCRSRRPSTSRRRSRAPPVGCGSD